jgi:alpha-galactosidase
MFGALIDPAAQRAIIAGQIGAADQFAQVFGDTRQGKAALTLTCDLDGVPLGPGQSIASEEMYLQLVDLPAEEPFGGYFDAVARQMQPRRSSFGEAGWGSWYYYFPRVREEDVIANLKTADDLRQTAPIDLIQIDDGFQTKTGDWLSVNGKFPHGMKWLADQIRQAGHTPGLWLAPFIATRSSQLARQHPDWLIHDDEEHALLVAKNWGEDAYGLDMTHPGARDYVRHVIDTVVCEWGYPFLKLDFLVAAARYGLRHDPGLTRAQSLRRGLELIRETAGEDVFLLGCGCPLGPAIGIVDGMRIGPDIAPDQPTWLPRYKGVSLVFKGETDFPSQRNAVRNVINRTGMHRHKWWLNDPDCLIVRPARHRNETETRSWASVVGLSGGMILLSDDLPSLQLDRHRYITSLLPPSGESALPLDLFERETPELYVLRQQCAWGSGVVAGVFNWDDRPRRKVVDVAQLGLDSRQPHHTFEFWSGEYRRVESRSIDLGELPAHGCAVVAIRPILNRPHLVATTFHLTMGGEVKKFGVEARKLEIGGWKLEVGVELKRHAQGELWIAGCQVQNARANGQPVAVRQAAPEVWALPIEVNGSAQIEAVLPTTDPRATPANSRRGQAKRARAGL